ncbi:ribosome biogenesis GTP-binding protein YihA/YsxC [Desulfothermus sp.]
MEFILKHTIYEIGKIPTIENPQIPVAGRSNVGKSSFINCILGQKNLAKTSSKPGKTKSINFYFIKKFKGYLVDLPGYGYAKTSKKERQKWATLVDNYFKKNVENIKGVILLIDSRLPPQQADINLFNYITDKGFKVIPILTKEDKANMSAKNRIKNFWQDFSGSTIEPILFSSKTSKGKAQIVNVLMSIFKS